MTDFLRTQKAKIIRKQLSQAGFTLICVGESIRCTPKPSPEITSTIRDWKVELQNLIRSESASKDHPPSHNDGATLPQGDRGADASQPPADVMVVWVAYECSDGETRHMPKDDFDEIDWFGGVGWMMLVNHARKPRGRVHPYALAVGATPKAWEVATDTAADEVRAN